MSIFFEWNLDMSVGEEMIDTQHKKLLAQLNKIIEALAFGTQSDELKNAIIFFDEYTKEHFKYEEEYMQKINYPKIREHRSMHNDFVQNYVKFKEEFNQNVPEDKLLGEIEKYIGNWWLVHINKEDKKYHSFAEGKIE